MSMIDPKGSNPGALRDNRNHYWLANFAGDRPGKTSKTNDKDFEQDLPTNDFDK